MSHTHGAPHSEVSLHGFVGGDDTHGGADAARAGRASPSLQPLLVRPPGDADRVDMSSLLPPPPSPLTARPTSAKDRLAADRARQKLTCAVVLCFIFMGAEVVGGYNANSLAIMTDAAHLLSDVAGLLISLFSLWCVVCARV